MAKKISKTKGLVCVSLVFVLSRRNEKAVRDFSEVFCFLFFYFFFLIIIQAIMNSNVKTKGYKEP